MDRWNELIAENIVNGIRYLYHIPQNLLISLGLSGVVWLIWEPLLQLPQISPLRAFLCVLVARLVLGPPIVYVDHFDFETPETSEEEECLENTSKKVPRRRLKVIDGGQG